MGVGGAGRTLKERDGDPSCHLDGLKGPGVNINGGYRARSRGMQHEYNEERDSGRPQERSGGLNVPHLPNVQGDREKMCW